MKRLAALLAALALAGPALDRAAAQSLSDLAFLEGSWRGGDGGAFVFEETWFPPAAGVMTGMARGYRGETLSVLEYIVVAEEAAGVVKRFKHYRADFSTWESDGPLTLRLVEAKPGDVLFRNVDPQAEVQTIRYVLGGDGALTAEIGLVRDGAPGGFTLVFNRLKD